MMQVLRAALKALPAQATAAGRYEEASHEVGLRAFFFGSANSPALMASDSFVAKRSRTFILTTIKPYRPQPRTLPLNPQP